jgi:CRISPR-associated endonuclease/helicase Cas3
MSHPPISIPNVTDDSEPFAHSLEGQPCSAWEPLAQHLTAVAQLAERFASVFGSGPWGRLAGLWHDLGKYRPEFQRRLRGSGEHVEHAGLGAALAAEKGRGLLPIAFAIAGHHSGLANRAARGTSDLSSLSERLERNKAVLDELRSYLPAELLTQPAPEPPDILMRRSQSPALDARRWELWTRMLFSALVDADRLATEAFYESDKSSERAAGFESVAGLRHRLDAKLAAFSPSSPMNQMRARVLADCRVAAEQSPGFFSLAAPTGSGKTLSAMAFALAHAERHGLRRVIVVVPYTTIIEQNATVYCEALGVTNVIEHHASIDEDARYEAYRDSELRRRLATENWDAPVIVTTTVQFFESLFSNHPSRCRKLHNVARSVVILDEAQCLPAQFLTCLVEGMRELVETYGSTVVISTATQPALGRRPSLPEGLETVNEIIRNPSALGAALRRVDVHWPDPGADAVPYSELAEQVAGHDQVLAVVHLRSDARNLASLLPRPGRYHLSALMCAAHRTTVLGQVRDALRQGSRCRLVATPLIEAGVDVDFPVVYRALAGLDSLAQAAGRCNREGVLERGRFIVFKAESSPPAGILRMGLDATISMLARHGAALSIEGGVFFAEYFRMLYHAVDRDRKGVQPEREQFNFASVADKVRLVEDGYRRPIVVLWGEAEARLVAYRRHPARDTLRALQPYIVQITDRELMKLRSIGAAEEVCDGLAALTVPYRHLYDARFGLVADENAAADPEALIVSGS